MIDTLRAAGYTTALYGECMNDPPANWYRNATTGQPYGGSIHSNAVNSTAKSFTGSNATTTTSVGSSTPSAVQGGGRRLRKSDGEYDYDEYREEPGFVGRRREAF